MLILQKILLIIKVKYMKKYKLIKSYPHSPPLNSIAIPYNGSEGFINHNMKIINPDGVTYGYIHSNLLDEFKEFWQEIVEIKKDYEILSFIDIFGKIYIKNNRKDDNEDYFIPKDFSWDGKRHRTEEFLLKNSNTYKIHSVKRISDNQIFTINDEVTLDGSLQFTGKINRFEIHDEINFIIVWYANKGWDFLKTINKLKQKLFTTEDQIDIFEGDKYYIIGKYGEWKITEQLAHKFSNNNNSDYAYFRNLNAIEEYRIMNKPCLSLKEVLSILKQPLYHNHTNKRYEDVLTTFTKSKL